MVVKNLKLPENALIRTISGCSLFAIVLCMYRIEKFKVVDVDKSRWFIAISAQDFPALSSVSLLNTTTTYTARLQELSYIFTSNEVA